MSKLILNALDRAGKSVDTLRAASLVPAVVYGHKFGNKPVAIAYSDFAKAFKEAGYSVVVTLVIDGKEESVLVKDIQRHPVSGRFQHVDLFALVATERVSAKVALKLVGEAPAKRDGAVIDLTLHDIEVRCLPKDLVKEFAVDATKLEKIGDILHVKDLGIDMEKYHLTIALDAAVVAAHQPKKVEEETPVAAAATAAPADGSAPAADGAAPAAGATAAAPAAEAKAAPKKKDEKQNKR